MFVRGVDYAVADNCLLEVGLVGRGMLFAVGEGRGNSFGNCTYLVESCEVVCCGTDM